MITWAISPDKLLITSKYVYTSSVELYFRVTVTPDYLQEFLYFTYKVQYIITK